MLMGIWEHKDPAGDRTQYLMALSSCPFCDSSLSTLHSRTDIHDNTAPTPDGWSIRTDQNTSVEVCQSCGWWRMRQNVEIYGNIGDIHGRVQSKLSRGAAASLLELDLRDISVPLEEVERTLIAKRRKRFEINPYVLEQVVADVFRADGFRAMVTGRSTDGGVDIILTDNDIQIGVQVKRWKNAVKAEQIRALVGALVLRGITEGVFVTTSRFQAGARSTVREYESKGFAIELYDGERFLEALELRKRPAYQSLDDFPFESWMKRLELQPSGWVTIT